MFSTENKLQYNENKKYLVFRISVSWSFEFYHLCMIFIFIVWYVVWIIKKKFCMFICLSFLTVFFLSWLKYLKQKTNQMLNSLNPSASWLFEKKHWDRGYLMKLFSYLVIRKIWGCYNICDDLWEKVLFCDVDVNVQTRNIL